MKHRCERVLESIIDLSNGHSLFESVNTGTEGVTISIEAPLRVDGSFENVMGSEGFEPPID